MGLFNMPKPRRFHHPYIYVDERKEHLDRLLEEARKKAGQPGGHPVRPGDIRGKLVGQTTHLRRWKERGTRPWHPAILLSLLVLLAFLWYILSGGTL